MLIKNWIWPGPTTGGDPNFPYLTTDTVTLTGIFASIPDTGILGNNPEFNDAPGVPGQNDPNPPGWFKYGDHQSMSTTIWSTTPRTASGHSPASATGRKPHWPVSPMSPRPSAGTPRASVSRTYTLYGHMGLP